MSAVAFVAVPTVLTSPLHLSSPLSGVHARIAENVLSLENEIGEASPGIIRRLILIFVSQEDRGTLIYLCLVGMGVVPLGWQAKEPPEGLQIPSRSAAE
jgi:hypothetical protein